MKAVQVGAFWGQVVIDVLVVALSTRQLMSPQRVLTSEQSFTSALKVHHCFPADGALQLVGLAYLRRFSTRVLNKPLPYHTSHKNYFSSNSACFHWIEKAQLFSYTPSWFARGNFGFPQPIVMLITTAYDE